MRTSIKLLRGDKQVGEIDPGTMPFYVPRVGEEFVWHGHVYKVYRVSSGVFEQLKDGVPWQLFNEVTVFLASTTEQPTPGDRF